MGKAFWLFGDTTEPQEPWGPYPTKEEAAWTRDRVYDQREWGMVVHAPGGTDESGKKTRAAERAVWWI